jgi:hypothetical protein
VFEDGELERYLAEATPETVVSWLRFKTFGKNTITKKDKAKIRSSTVEMSKKALSFYMPDSSPWRPETRSGNPTRNKLVNNFVRYIKQKEVRKDGQGSSAKRALTQTEFRAALTVLFSKHTFHLQYRIPTMMKLQYHLIMRSDDLGHFKTSDLKGHSDPRYCPFALLMKVSWSKNVMEERDCPDQILFGSMDSSYCILLALSIYLESWITSYDGMQSIFMFSDDTDVELAPNRTKSSYSDTLRNHVFSDQFFLSQTGTQDPENLGTHSLRKYPATWASWNDCTREEIEVRGRWRSNTQQVVTTYINVKQEYRDAKVHAALCVGGPIKYKLVDGCGITPAWCIEHVVPGICRYYGNNANAHLICNVLALPLLFACFDPDLKSTVPDDVLNRITNAYSRLHNTLPDTVNPVQRVLLNIYRVNTTLHIDELLAIPNNNDNNNNTENVNNNTYNNIQQNNNAINAIFVQIQQLKQQLLTQHDESTTNVNNFKSDVFHKLNIMNNNIQRIAIQPPRMATPQQRNNNALDAARAEEEADLIRGRRPAVLSRHPRTLHELWKEYKYGIGENKPAQDFTAEERGRVKFKYCRRKIVWDLIALHVRAGSLASDVIDRIYDSYGRNLSVSAIIDKIKDDRAINGHPNLQV